MVMNVDKLPPPERIEALARRAGAERSLYLGEMIGEGISVTWTAMKSLGHWVADNTIRPRHTHRHSH
jgi:hypothetical protein